MLRATLPANDPFRAVLIGAAAPIIVRIGDAAPLVLPPSPAIGTYAAQCASGEARPPGAAGNGVAGRRAGGQRGRGQCRGGAMPNEPTRRPAVHPLMRILGQRARPCWRSRACVPRREPPGAAAAAPPRRRRSASAAAARAAAGRLAGRAAQPRRLALRARSGDAARHLPLRRRRSFAIRCEPGARCALRWSGAQAQAIVIRTSYGERRLPVSEVHINMIVVDLPPSDPLLDQMAFSRGRFLVQAEGGAALVLPAWPELGAGDRGLPRAIKKTRADFKASGGAPREADGILASK